MAEKDFKHLVRIANTDLNGNQRLAHALTKIKGVNFSLANAIAAESGVDKTKKTGDLSDEEVKKIDNMVKELSKTDLPNWIFNREKDYETGEDVHLTGADLELRTDFDIKRLKKIKAYRGVRHMQGLPVRGQRTKANFRTNKGKVQGVKKKKGTKSGRV